jgi:hypothetical protein
VFVCSVKVDYVLIREDPILVTNEEGEKRPRDRKKAVIFKNILNAFIHCNVFMAVDTRYFTSASSSHTYHTARRETSKIRRIIKHYEEIRKR